MMIIQKASLTWAKKQLSMQRQSKDGGGLGKSGGGLDFTACHSFLRRLSLHIGCSLSTLVLCFETKYMLGDDCIAHPSLIFLSESRPTVHCTGF